MPQFYQTALSMYALCNFIHSQNHTQLTPREKVHSTSCPGLTPTDQPDLEQPIVSIISSLPFCSMLGPALLFLPSHYNYFIIFGSSQKLIPHEAIFFTASWQHRQNA